MPDFAHFVAFASGIRFAVRGPVRFPFLAVLTFALASAAVTHAQTAPASVVPIALQSCGRTSQCFEPSWDLDAVCAALLRSSGSFADGTRCSVAARLDSRSGDTSFDHVAVLEVSEPDNGPVTLHLAYAGDTRGYARLTRLLGIDPGGGRQDESLRVVGVRLDEHPARRPWLVLDTRYRISESYPYGAQGGEFYGSHVERTDANVCRIDDGGDLECRTWIPRTYESTTAPIDSESERPRTATRFALDVRIDGSRVVLARASGTPPPELRRALGAIDFRTLPEDGLFERPAAP